MKIYFFFFSFLLTDSTQYISELVSGVSDEQERQQISQLLITRSKLDIGELIGKGTEQIRVFFPSIFYFFPSIFYF